MRESSPIEPMWEAEGQGAPPSGPGSSVLRTAARFAGRVARTLNPPLHRWLIGKAPTLRISWGPNDYELRPDGVVTHRRDGEGWGDNPRSNYNDRFEKKKGARRDEEERKQSDASVSEADTPKKSPRKSSRKRASPSIPENGGGTPTAGSS